MATRPGSATNSGSSAVPLIQKRAERPPRARSMNEQMVMHLKALREIAMADQITQESKQKELVFLNATMDRIEVQMKASNADNNLRIQGLHEEQKRLGDIIEDDMERRKEWEKELLIFMKDAVTKVSTELGSGGTGGPESSHLGSQRTVHQIIKIATHYVRYDVFRQVLDTQMGAEMYDATRGSASRPSDIIVSACTFANGGNESWSDVKRFLNQRYPNNNSSSKKTYSLLAQAQGRAIEALRSQFVRAFRLGLGTEHPLNPKNDIEASGDVGFDDLNPSNTPSPYVCTNRTAKQTAASYLFESGTFKTDAEFDGCWEKAWFTAQKEARIQAAICVANLRDVAELTQLPSLPPRPRNQEEGRLVSIFSLALLRVKVTKDLEKTADGNGREMRQSHAPLWAKEAMRLNDFLRNVAENVHCLNDDDDASGDGTEIPIGVLRVRRLMSSDEHSKLDDF